MKRFGVLLAIVCVLLIGGSVLAHAELIASEPAAGAQLAESPAEIRLTFDEAVGGNSSIMLLTEGFEAIEGLVPQFNPAQPEQMYTPLPELEPGVYTVQWTAASADGHEVGGTYTFSVGLVEADTVPATDPAAAPDATAEQGGSGLQWWLIALIALAVGIPLLIVAARRMR